MTDRALRRGAVTVAAVTAFSRALGFVRVLTVAAVLGTTYLGNTFQGANSVSNVLFELVAAGALSAVLVPTFVAHLDRGEREHVERLAGGLLGIAAVVLGIISVAGVLAAPWLARALTAGAREGVAADQRELATFLLRFFVPQVALYAWGAIATAALHADRRFVAVAAAPIGNTVVTVAALVAFAAVVPGPRGLGLDLDARLLLALAGTGGVLAFVGVLVAAARSAGFRLRPTLRFRDPAIARLLRLSGWGILLHAAAGLLLAGALVIGNSVEGGVVAYQTAFVFFLAPYAILSQPIQTALLPEMSSDAANGDLEGFVRSVRGALDGIALLVIPASAALVALALPIMRVFAFGGAQGTGVELLAAALASLSAGLFGYGAFLLLARAYYALGDSRTPAFVALASGVAGVVMMVVGASVSHGAARVASLGIGHSMAYLIGAGVLGVGLTRRTDRVVVSARLAGIAVLATLTAIAAWVGMRAVDPSGRMPTFVALVVVVSGCGAIFAGSLRLVGLAAVPRFGHGSGRP